MYKFLLSMACVLSLSAEMVGGVAVVVKDKAITIYDIEKEMQSSNLNMQNATNVLIRQKLEEAEIKERRITVSSGEVYDDIKETAKRNNMSVNDFYETALNSGGLDSEDVKEKVKQKLLSQKLYSAITYTQLSQPTEDEIKEYYELNKDKYTHPSAFSTVIYQANDKSILQQKTQNPMFYAPQIQTNEQVLPYDRISPELANLLNRTPLNTFTPVIPNGSGGYMSFYIKEIQSAKESQFEDIKNQILNTIMSNKREQVLSDYFARLRNNAEINIIRMPK
ncbi:MAG: peptidyl-prolyl cis-trans isomerase [Sulfurimonas sp.]|nr:peptidyl-prolyl cis-trans isomerase [Sulfurimonas sp.]